MRKERAPSINPTAPLAAVPAAQMEKERKEGQSRLALLSNDHKQVFVYSGHNMDLEAPAGLPRFARL
jgi:hypothetical protein